MIKEKEVDFELILSYDIEAMNHTDLYNLLKTVQKNIRCPQCGKPYDFKNIKIRGVADPVAFLELHCGNHMPVLATVALNKSDKKQPVERKNLSSNDVLETYRFLKNFSGGFDKLFENK